MNHKTEGSAPATQQDVQQAPPAWMAVFSLTMGVFGLLTAEYLPASLLTPMASDLQVTEALAGQAVTVTAVIALFAGLLVPGLTRKLDRRTVLLSFTVLMIASNLLVALSSSLAVLLVMRILLGVALGGFWSMAAAVAMRLVPEKPCRGHCRLSSVVLRWEPSFPCRWEAFSVNSMAGAARSLPRLWWEESLLLFSGSHYRAWRPVRLHI